VWFSRSADGGATWSAPAKVNDQKGNNDQFNQWLVVDETNGTLGLIYNDTIGDSKRLGSDVWFQTSFDNGATWNPPYKVTTSMTDETAETADEGNQYGDYNSLSGFAGTFFPSWTDRRSGGMEEIWTAKLSVMRPAESSSVSGRVLRPDGRPLASAYVRMYGADGVHRVVRTSALGFFQFDGVPKWGTYLVAVSSKAFRFPTQAVTVTDNVTDLTFNGVE
jgi:hypothetical protein